MKPVAPKKKTPRKVKPGADRNELRLEFYQGIDEEEWELAEAIRRFRIMLGMTQRQFAEFVDVSPRVVMAFEQGSGNPTLKTVEKMLKGSGLRLSLARRGN